MMKITNSNSAWHHYSWLLIVIPVTLGLLKRSTDLEYCNGLPSILGLIFLKFGFYMLVVLLIIRSIRRIIKTSGHYHHWIMVILLIMAGLLVWPGHHFWKTRLLGQPQLVAYSEPDRMDIAQIELYQGQKYIATYGHIDWTCQIQGTYSIYRDTLFLSGQVSVESGSVLADQYVVTDSVLYPIVKGSTPERQVQLFRER